MKLSGHIRKIGVFRALQLGDLLCAVPALRALRKAYPGAEIILLGLPWARAFTARFEHYFDGFIHFPGYPGLPEQAFNAAEFAAFLPEVHREDFDLIIQMQGNGSVINPMVELLGAKQTAGFKTAGHYAPDSDLYLPYPEHLHEIERHLRLMAHLGIDAQGTDLEFPLTATDYSERNCVDPTLEAGQYVCIHPGSRGGWRQWPTGHFAALADVCAAQGYRVVVTGTKNELAIVHDVIGRMHHPAINAAGKTTLGAIGVLIKNAAMLISNCTGVSHIAAACKTPSVVISMDGEPERWGPINRQLHRTINWLQLPDFNTALKETETLLEAFGRQVPKASRLDSDQLSATETRFGR